MSVLPRRKHRTFRYRPQSESLEPRTLLSLALARTMTLRGDYVATGVGLRGKESGNLVIEGIPEGSRVERAYLYYGYLDDGESVSLRTIDFAGQRLTATHVGSDVDTDWSRENSHAYRLDVTPFVTGNGVYQVSNIASDGQVLAQGASLVVIYRNDALPSRRFQIYDGNDVLNPLRNSSSVEATFSDLLVMPGAEIRTTWIVGDGQQSEGGFQEDVRVSGSAGTLRFDNVFTGSDGGLWDTITRPITPILSPGDESFTASIASEAQAGDALMWVAQVVATTTEPVRGPLQIVATEPAAGASLAVGPDQITIRFNGPVDEVAQWPGAFVLLASGGDGTFTDGNEQAIRLRESIGWDPATNTLTLTPERPLAGDSYRLTARSVLAGETLAPLGRDVVVPFRVETGRPSARNVRIAIPGGKTSELSFDTSDPDGDPLTIEIISGPSHGTILPGVTRGIWHYSPAPGFEGIDRLVYRAVDPHGAAATAELVLDVTATAIDLRPAGLDIVSTGETAAGRPLAVAWEVANAGPVATTRSWTDEIYLSRDATLSSGDTLLGKLHRDATQLAAGGSYRGQVTAEIPTRGDWVGDAYLIIVANADRAQLESDRANNVLVKPIRIDPSIRLLEPTPGQFVDTISPVLVRWNDLLTSDQAADATVSLILDNDDNPTNGSPTTVLRSGLPAGPDGAADQFSLSLTGIAPGSYHLFVRLDFDDAGTPRSVASTSVPLRVFEEAFRSYDGVGDVGGGAYEVQGIELGRLGDLYTVRVRTNFQPDGGRGGDLFLNVGGSYRNGTGEVIGLAINDGFTRAGQPLTPGDLYRGATFEQGRVLGVPAFVQAYRSTVTGQSGVVVTQVEGRDWEYEIVATFNAAAVGAEPGDRIEAGWTMYCGNDFALVDNGAPAPDDMRDDTTPPGSQPPEVERLPLDLIATGIEIVNPSQDSNEIHWGGEIELEYTVTLTGPEDVPTQNTIVYFYLTSHDPTDPANWTGDFATQFLGDGSESNPPDRYLGSEAVLLPDFQGERTFTGRVTVTLPKNPPPGYRPSDTITIAMRVDPNDEIDEINNSYNNVDFVTTSVGPRISLINVLTHGFNPSFWDFDDFWRDWRTTFPNALDTASKGTEFEGRMYNESILWDSSSGWIESFGFRLASLAGGRFVPLIYKPFFSLTMAYFAQQEMKRAARYASMAASSILPSLQQAGVLAPADEGQLIHLIGHSRGGAVNALGVRRLEQAGYQVAQYTALDGYSTDWPFPSGSLGDFSIVENAAGADRRINFRVEQGLLQIATDFVAQALSSVLPSSMGTSLDGMVRDLVQEYTDWRAPNRDGFENITIKSVLPGILSNHINISKIYFLPELASQPNSPWVFYGPLGRGLTRTAREVAGEETVGIMAMSNNIMAMSNGDPLGDLTDPTRFEDGAFRVSGALQWQREHLAALLAAESDPEVIALMRPLVTDLDPLGASWEIEGPVRLIDILGNPRVELTQSAATSIGQPVDLGESPRELSFELTTLAAGPGDTLEVWLDDQRIGSVALTPGVGTRVSRIPLTNLNRSFGVLRLRLAGPLDNPAVIELDNLALVEPGATLNRAPELQPIVPFSITTGETVRFRVEGSDPDASGRITYSLDPGAPVGATIDPQTGEFSWSETMTPGVHEFTIRATDGHEFQRSATQRVVVTVHAPATPTSILRIERHGYHNNPTSLVIQLSGPVNPATADSVGTYILTTPGLDRRLGTTDDRTIPIRSASYDPTTHQILLQPGARLALARRYGLTILGGTGGLIDNLGRPIDGDGDGLPGGDHRTTITRRNLVPPPRPPRPFGRSRALESREARLAARRERLAAIRAERSIRRPRLFERPNVVEAAGKRTVSLAWLKAASPRHRD